MKPIRPAARLTRNKHSPLNGYVSFASSPAGSAGDGDPTLDEVIPGPETRDPVIQAISSEEMKSKFANYSLDLQEVLIERQRRPRIVT